MADIGKPIVFTREQKQLIADAVATPSFTHRDWGAEDLEPLRSAVREYYRVKQKGRCAYCKKDVSLRSASNCHVEHIAPKSKYQQFMFEPKNLCVICADCNEIKREQEVHVREPDTIAPKKAPKQYPRSSNAFRIVHPHFDTYDDHIFVFGQFYVDKSDKGLFTIGACMLNRKLRKFGWTPEFDQAAINEAAGKLLEAKDPNERTHAMLLLKRLFDSV